jgi:RHS repeat-associated protein
VAGTTKDDGQSEHNYRYDGFGQLLPDTGNVTEPHNHFTFSGKEWDENTELYDFGARNYDASAGVWLTADPYRGEISPPLSLHRSAYVHQSPISYGDDYGYRLTEYDGGGGAGAGGGSSSGSGSSGSGKFRGYVCTGRWRE